MCSESDRSARGHAGGGGLSAQRDCVPPQRGHPLPVEEAVLPPHLLPQHRRPTRHACLNNQPVTSNHRENIIHYASKLFRPLHKMCSQFVSRKRAKLFGRCHNTALFELITCFQFPYRLIYFVERLENALHRDEMINRVQKQRYQRKILLKKITKRLHWVWVWINQLLLTGQKNNYRVKHGPQWQFRGDTKQSA